ncbi:WD40 repeat-like protein [Meredithblackwellia eburnea MCA 4105]
MDLKGTKKVILEAELKGHSERAWHSSWSPASPLIASCSTDKSIRIYSFTPTNSASSSDSNHKDDEEPAYRFSLKSTIPTSHGRTVRSLSFSPTGTTLATASFDATVGIWQQVDEAGLDDGEEGGGGGGGGDGDWEAIDPLEGHESECKSAEWSADGRLLASCSRDKSVWVWEAVGPAEFECLAVLMNHTQDVKSLTWHPYDELLASASYDDTIKLFASDPYDDEWSCIATLNGHTSTVWSVSFSPCGQYLASVSDDLTIKIWGRDTLGTAQQLLDEAGGVQAQRSEGGRMGPWSGGGGVRIGMKEKWEWTLKGELAGMHGRTIYSVDWKEGGVEKKDGGLGRIVTCGGDGVINVFQMSQPTSPTPTDATSLPMPMHDLLARITDSHGVSDVNHVAWCGLSPSKAAETLRRLEGGDDDDDEDEAKEEGGEEDPRWRKAKDLFASAGDDGVVKVWRVLG